jgi:hypothetical protein
VKAIGGVGRLPQEKSFFFNWWWWRERPEVEVEC